MSTDRMNPFEEEKQHAQHMAGDPDNIQPSFMVVSKEKISFANHSYFCTYTT